MNQYEVVLFESALLFIELSTDDDDFIEILL